MRHTEVLPAALLATTALFLSAAPGARATTDITDFQAVSSDLSALSGENIAIFSTHGSLSYETGNTLDSGILGGVPGTSLQGGGPYTGGTDFNVDFDVTGLTNTLAKLAAAPDYSFTSNQSFTNNNVVDAITVGSGDQVVDINGGLSLGQAGSTNLTLSGNADSYVIVVINGQLQLNNESVLVSGIDPSHVLWYVENGNINSSGGGTLDGTFLDTGSQISLNGGTLNGAVIGDNPQILNETINGKTLQTFQPHLSAAPEPSQVGMLGLIGLSLGGLMLRARRTRRTA